MSDWSSDVCSSDLWREEKEPGVASFEDLIGLFAVIAGQVVEDHDVARIQRRRELGFDVDSKDLFGHRPVDDPGSSQAIAESLAQRILRPPALAANALGFGLIQTAEGNQTIASGTHSPEHRTVTDRGGK